MTTLTPARTCATCTYFVHEDGPYGQCHFQPPAPVWAKVAPRDWCGQHMPALVLEEAGQFEVSVPKRRKGGAA